MPVINRIADFHDEMKVWRQHIHANPELLFDTKETAEFVVSKLREFGVDEISEGWAQNGVVAVIEGKGDGPVIGLRADMDALPIQEVRDLPYKSKNDGVMHACGHDGHTTMLLGAAKYLAETRNFKGKVALIFQPAEEGGGGGGVMCEEGMMDKFDIGQVFGLHNWPGEKVGYVAAVPGPVMAAADTFDITVIGTGAHAARPHGSVDPIIVGSQIISGLQTIAARNTDPVKAIVVSVTQFHAGTTHNVIPERASISGTVRTLEPEVRDLAEKRMKEVVEGIAAAHGAKIELNYERGYPTTVNHPEEAEFAAQVAEGVVGNTYVTRTRPPVMGGEDFSYMLEERPGAYVFIGAGEGPGLHNENYDFNDDVSPIGASWLVKLVETAQPPSV